MVAISFDFIHPFRSTAGLARKVKWTARSERWNRRKFLRVEATWKQRIEDAISHGLYDEVSTIFQEVINVEGSEEKKLAIIVKNEELVEFDEKKKDVEDHELAVKLEEVYQRLSRYSNLKGPVGDKLRAKVEELNAKSKEFHSHMGVVDDKVRLILGQLKADYKTLISVKTAALIQSERARFSEVVVLAKRQVSQIKKVNRDVDMVKLELTMLWRYLNALQKTDGKAMDAASSKALNEAPTLLDKAFSYQEDLFSNMMAEAEEFLTIIEQTVHAYVDIYDDAMKNMPATIAQLEKEGYPEAELEVLRKASAYFFGVVRTHAENAYRYAVYNQKK